MIVLPSGLPEHISDDEELARFLTSSSQYSSVMVKPSAFLPNPKDGETSVFRYNGEPKESLWQLGQEHIAGERTLHGAAICKASTVRSAMLAVIAQEPPPRHANITNWPESPTDPVLQKAQQKERALIIAQNAQLVRVEMV